MRGNWSSPHVLVPLALELCNDKAKNKSIPENWKQNETNDPSGMSGWGLSHTENNSSDIKT